MVWACLRDSQEESIEIFNKTSKGILPKSNYKGENKMRASGGGPRVPAGLSSSGVKTADAAIKASPGNVYWITISVSAAAVIGIADSTSNSTTYEWKVTIPTDGYAHYILDPPLELDTGIWLDIASGTTDVIVGYI